MSEARKTTTVKISKISTPKPYDVLANQLREAILRGDIPGGDALPSERKLVLQTGLTRGSVREALRIFAVEGLVQTTQGRWGGNIVTLPDNDAMAMAISQFVRGRKLSLRTLHETRETLEPALARLAAQRRTEADLVQLKSLHAQLVASTGKFQQFSLVNIKWHNAVAVASGNELLRALLHSVSYGVAITTTTEGYDTMETRHEVIRVHSRIIDAIEARKPEEAEHSMRLNIGATRSRAHVSKSMDILLFEET